MATLAKYLYSEHHSHSGRQDTATSSPGFQTSLLVGASLAGLFLSKMLSVSSQPRPRLESHPMCGITSGGRVSYTLVFFCLPTMGLQVSVVLCENLSNLKMSCVCRRSATMTVTWGLTQLPWESTTMTATWPTGSTC